MGIYSALSTSVTGLQAQSFALEQISGNIANSQTTGYKRTETNFVDLVPDAPPERQISGGVLASASSTNGVQGDIQAADIETFVAVDGDGFFVVSEAIGQSDGLPTFSGTDMYTRRGDFMLDKNGYLVNGAGYYLQGLSVDPTTGNVSGSVPDPIKVSNDFLDAEPTTQVTYRANLAAYPLTANADAATADSELLDVADFNNDPTTNGAGATNGFVQADDEADFIASSIAGGAITAYDATGASVNVQFRWAKIDNSGGGGDEWNLFYLTDSDATGANVMWQNAGQSYQFDATGQLNPAVNSVTLSAVSVDGISLGDINLQHGSGGITQFADPNGTARVTELYQDGYPAGELVSISISDSGRVTSFYSNSQQVELAEVVLAGFNAENELRKVDGGAFLETPESGTPVLGTSGNIIGGALEASNTDIADEFSKLIITQQAYTANTRIITTSDEMLQEALNIVR